MGRKVEEGCIMSDAEEESMHEYEKERYGRVLERDVNGDPVDAEGGGFGQIMARAIVNIFVGAITHLLTKSK